MLILPENVPQNLIPLAWLAGSWQGFGTIVQPHVGDGHHAPELSSYPQPLYVIFDVRYQFAGDGLVETRRAFHASAPADGPAVSISEPAATGLDRLIPGDLWWEERAQWTVTSSAVATSSAPAHADIEVDSSGVVTIACPADAAGEETDVDSVLVDVMEDAHQARWTAHVEGPRVTMSTTSFNGVPVERIERNYGLVGGELMMVQDVYQGTSDMSEWGIRMEKTGVDV